EHETTLPKLFGPLAERFKNRKGGYTRIHKLGNRFGDNAPVAVIELIDGPGDLKNQMLFKALARQEAIKPGSIKEIVEANLNKASSSSTKTTATETETATVTGTTVAKAAAAFKNKALARHIPKVMSSNKWELNDLEAK
ncbi:hypothetical protein BX616_009515, partial [Lobosporangium transversale]